MKPKILISHPVDTENLNERFSSLEFDCLPSASKKYEEVSKVISQYDGLFSLQVNVDQDLLDKASRLKVVVNYGVGYDNIDVPAATKRNVLVSNLPESTSLPTAELAMTLILSLLRGTVRNHNDIHGGQLNDWGVRSILGNSLQNKTLGILGMGRIGKWLARLAAPFGVHILYHNRREAEDVEDLNVQYVSLDKLLSESHIISVHTPLTDQTRGFINGSCFAKMKSEAVIINTARGPVIDESALIHALDTGQIAGAALDVFDHEPSVNPLLLNRPNVIVSPHVGTGTTEAREAMFQEGISNLAAFFSGGRLTGIVNG